jgi:hypothetical protein
MPELEARECRPSAKQAVIDAERSEKKRKKTKHQKTTKGKKRQKTNLKQKRSESWSKSSSSEDNPGSQVQRSPEPEQLTLTDDGSEASANQFKPCGPSMLNKLFRAHCKQLK